MIDFFSISCVSILWGITNPLIKQGTGDIKHISAESRMKRLNMELYYLITNPGYLVPMGLNQLGSLLYFFTLQDTKLSMIVPVTNSLTFVITTITSILLGEKWPSKRECFGLVLILIGAICCYSDNT